MALRVLLADDEPSVLSAIKLLLEQEVDVHVVGEVTDASSLQSWLPANTADMVLLDWRLPGKPAADLIKLLHSSLPSAQIIVLDSSPQTRREAIVAGADNFVSKVDPSEQLLAVLEATRRILGASKIKSGPVIPRTGRDFNYGEFSGIRVSSAIRLSIVYASIHRVIINNSDIDRVKVEKNGEILNINRRGWFFNFQGQPEVTVEMPELSKFILSGLSQCVIEGIRSDRPLSIDVSGAGTLELKDVTAGESRIKVSGASHATGSFRAGDTELEVNGASWTVLSGSARALHLLVHGASHAELEDFPVDSVKAEIHGASHGTINTNGNLNAHIHGASHLYWLGNPVMGEIDISGASHIQRR